MNLRRLAYEAEVLSAVWTEKDLDVQAQGFAFHEVALVGAWPETMLRVVWERATGRREVEFPMWADDGSERDAAVQVAGDLLQGIYEGAVGGPIPRR